MTSATDTVESAVQDRYARGARKPEGELCCPVDSDPRYLEAIPDEVLERDYGCGDPSRHLEAGDTVLDLGSGSGKTCFIASQIVGPSGKVIGVDMTPEMLEVARRNAPIVADRIGHANVEFHRGRIQDLALDLERLDRELARSPVDSADALLRIRERAEELRRTEPMIPDDAVDVVVSNCVLNLVDSSEKRNLFQEIRRVLRRGGRAVISDIVSDEPVPAEMQRDPKLWSGCISGAFTEHGFLEAFEDAAFHGIRIRERDEAPWRVVQGIEFRSVTVEAFTGTEGPCRERRQAVIYRGPFKEVLDDDGHRIERGSATRSATRPSTCSGVSRTGATSTSWSRTRRSRSRRPRPSTARGTPCDIRRRPRARTTTGRPAPRAKPAPGRAAADHDGIRAPVAIPDEGLCSSRSGRLSPSGDGRDPGTPARGRPGREPLPPLGRGP